MKLRRAVLSLGFTVVAACPSAAGTDDQKTEQVVAKQAAQDGFRLCNLTGQPIEVAKATFSAKRPTNEAFVAEGWYQFQAGQCQVLWVGNLQYRYYLIYAQNKSAGREWKGDIPVCVGREAFALKSPVCRSDQYQRLFMQVDTKDSENWTHNVRP
jgi:uncharacterized membrane protein